MRNGAIRRQHGHGIECGRWPQMPVTHRGGTCLKPYPGTRRPGQRLLGARLSDGGFPAVPAETASPGRAAAPAADVRQPAS
jgi:hypothetical protein